MSSKLPTAVDKKKKKPVKKKTKAPNDDKKKLPPITTKVETNVEKARRVWASSEASSTRVAIHYASTYKTLFECREGFVRWKDIDDEYAISFVFAGNFQKRLRCDGREPEILGDNDDVYWEVDPNLIYILEIDEDQAAGLNIKTTSGPIHFAPTTTEVDPIHGNKRKEGCSCLFGNPCLDPEVCENWHNRFDIAKKNGWKGYS